MTLIANVQARVNAQHLAELTRHGAVDATTVDTTLLGYACTDAQADFGLRTGVTYDDTDAEHVAAAVKGVLYFLYSYTGMGGKLLAEHETRWQDATRALAEARGSKRRIPPTTSSVYTPSESKAGSQPFFDVAKWRDYALDSPSSEGTDPALDGEVET